MKKTILTITTTLLTVAAFGQGIVNFSNASSTSGWADPRFDRYVHWSPLMREYSQLFVPFDPVSSNYLGMNFASLRAALYFAPASNNDPNFTGYLQAAGGAATFKVSTSATAGSWFGGNRTLDGILPGTPANLVVMVWDISVASDPLSPNAFHGVSGRSRVFQYTPPTNPQAQPSDFLMTGLTAFAIGPDGGYSSPEPSTLGLAAIGAAVLLIRRRNHSKGGRLLVL